MQDEIRHIEFTDHIRKRPGMYLGGNGSTGIVNLLKGLICDCIELTKSKKYFFKVTLEPEFDFKIDIESSDDITFFKTALNKEIHLFKNYHLKIAEVLSTKFRIETINDVNNICLTFNLDTEIFKEQIDYLELTESLMEFAYLNSNSEILVKDNRQKYLNQNYYAFPNGIKYLYDRLTKEALGSPEFEIVFEGKLNDLEYQIFLGYRTDWYPSPSIASFANDIHTTCGGSLVDGILEGLRNGCREYVKSNNLEEYKIKKKKFSNGLILTAQVRGIDFKYGGSFKETLEDKSVKKDVQQLIKSLTIDFINKNKEKADKFLWRFDESQMTSGMY